MRVMSSGFLQQKPPLHRDGIDELLYLPDMISTGKIERSSSKGLIVAESITVADALMQYGRALDVLDQWMCQSCSSSSSPSKAPASTSNQSIAPPSTHHQGAIAPPLDRILFPDAKIILEILATRDTLHKRLTEAKSVSAENWITVERLDKRLKDHSHLITKAIELKEWRSLTNRPESHWWWYVESSPRMPWLEKYFKWLNRFDAVWTFLTLLFLTMSITLVLDTMTRFVEGGVR